MNGVSRLATALVATVALGGGLSGCSAGGFGNKEPAQPDTTIRSYVALGDGFTAAPYVGKTENKECLRSARNYPALLATDLHVKVKDVSCTGVGTRALTHRTKAADTGAKLEAQVDAVTRDTDLVSIGVGIEDQDLLHQMFDICTTWPCRDAATRGETFVRDVERVGTSLADAVQEVLERAPSARIMLVGYPQITPTDGHCKQLPTMTQDQLDAVNTLLGQLNGQIRAVARQTAATYVDVAELSTGHELCSQDPWINGQKSVDGSSVAFHPRAAEQAAIAAQMKLQLGEQ